MKTRDTLEVLFLLFSWTVYFVTAVHRNDMFPYGTVNGDSALQEGDDEISKALKLKKPLYFYENQFSELYVATNGIISTQYLPMEKQYVDNGFPTDFPVIAPFLADIDTSNSRGTIYYRLEESPSVLNRVSREVRRGFPRIHFAATHTVIATWENVGAHEEVEAHPGPSSRVNTFQVVLAYDEVNTFALFLYPDDGLRFFGTRPKETYNVELELPARVGFSRAPPIYPHMEEPYYSVTSTEKTVKNLYQMGNTGVPGVWLFHIGNCFSFDNVVPAAVQWVAPTAMPLRENKEDADATISDYSEYVEDYFYDQTNDNNPKDQQGSELPPLAMPKRLPDHSATLLHSSLSRTKEPESLTVQPHVQTYDGDNPLTISSHLSDALPPTPPTPRREDFSIPKTRQSSSEGSSPMESLKAHRENIPVLESIPSLALHHHTVNIDEDLDFGTGVIDDNDGDDKMCASSEQACSPHGYCTEYSSGFCCHCHSGYYGNGRHCLSGGAPQRVNGRVSGLVYVGATPVALDNVDLHSYVVVNDGRAYTAISRLPEPVGWALMPVAPIGGLFGWLFALESPNHKNGFSITGAEFTSVAEITFFPGNQRLTIIQTAQGMSFENYLKMDTRIHGSLPFIVPGATVEREPYKEMYQYSPSSVVSSSVHNYKLVSAEGASETFSYQLHQSITYHECQHRPQSSPKTQQLNVERILITYVREEHVLRYAFTNKVGPVTAEAPGPVPANPCYDGTHDCDAKAQCLPGEGKHFQCQCNTGYRGDGRYCNDIDECKSQPCHTHASCSNTLGSFECQCLPGFQGNGFLCIPLKEWSQTKCEQHRDSLQRGLGHQGGQPAVGTFIPQCDEDGQYRPLQCHGATGHCWCVDSEGQELPSTRRPPGTPPIDCSAAGKALPTQHPETVCERWRKSLMEHYKGQPASSHYIPQCDNTGQFNPVQCYGDSNYCWCVDQDGREVPGTRLHDAVKPACIPTVAPPTTYPLSHPDVRAPLSGTSLLYAQGQQIGALPLNGTRMEKDKASILMALHGSIVVGINYNCMDKKVYWTDLAGRTINRASLEPGAEPETVVSTGLTSPEGLAVDVFRNRMFWVDSGLDKIETSNLDGSNRRVLFDTDLVNPRAIIVDSISGTLFWTDWNRDAPKIEQSTVEGLNRRILVHKGIGLPNALTFNPSTKHLCWADAGTKHLECIAPDGTRRQVIHSNLNYPFSMVLYANHFYYTDWRRDGVIALSRETSKFTDEFLPDQRSHLYGITVASPSCLSEKA